MLWLLWRMLLLLCIRLQSVAAIQTVNVLIVSTIVWGRLTSQHPQSPHFQQVTQFPCCTASTCAFYHAETQAVSSYFRTKVQVVERR